MSTDPFRYFRPEARELLEQLAQGLLALEQGTGDAALLAKLFRCAHTLKGAARVVRQARIAELSHAIEDALAPFRDSGQVLPAQSAGELLQLVAQMGQEVDTLRAPASEAAPRQERPTGGEPSAETVRVELGELDTLLDGLSEAVVRMGSLRAGVETVTQAWRGATDLLEALTAPAASSDAPAERARWLARALATAESLRTALTQAGRQLGGSLRQVEGQLSSLRDTTHALRLMPVETLFSALELAVRDAAAALGRSVTWSAQGGDIRVDGHVLAAVRQALLHVVRNAVDHGVEFPEERREAGKPEAGHIHLRVERRGARVRFTCEDDGRGVDLLEVRRTAVARGLVDEAEALDEAALLALLFEPGFSTATTVTPFSGRGVGLDVVRETVRRLKGEVRAHTRPGQGTRMELEVPISLTSLEVLQVEVGGQRALVPLDALRGTVRLGAAEVAWTGTRATIAHEGAAVAFLPLASVLGAQPPQERTRPWSVVLLEAAGASAALGVDGLRGIQRIVCKPLPAGVPPLPLVSGASFDAQGEPLLVLDAAGLVQRALEGASTAPRAARRVRRTRVLVIDDSVTTRMLEQSILESAGYEVELVASAEQGLETLKRRGFEIIIVDVEMPGMNGWDFTRTLRANPTWQSLPIIMVSSLSSEADRRRGRESGASAYIVKGEFDQHAFLETVSRLAGAPSIPLE